MNAINESIEMPNDEECPDYDAAMSYSVRSASSNSNAGGAGRTRWLPPTPTASPFADPLAPLHYERSVQRRSQRPPPRYERYLYTYNLVAATTPLQFLISVEPASGKPTNGKCAFKLSIRVNGIERDLGEPVVMRLAMDPRQLEFVVFVFPGKTSLPTGGLWSLRVWLRANGVDHRLFGEDELWIGKNIDFSCITDASFSRLKNLNSKEQVYHGFVGQALVNFIVRWRRNGQGSYIYSLDYEAGGVSSTLFDGLELRYEGDPRTITFQIYTVPISSLPTGASHKLRVWLRSLAPFPGAPHEDSYIYQRIWKSDSFKVGARLDFGSLGKKVIMGFTKGGPETIVSAPPPTTPSNSPDGKDKR
ncbi:hypothetical protein AX17_002120 [Amanita inopinata Kibby_2008]|nr:hypothetical protein AX17_002120 [Amanita inopinata Kibby_2008]